MTATLPRVVKQFQQDWTSQLEPEAILTACRGIAYRWRERTLDPVTTIQVFFVQILHGNTACTHLRHLTKLNVTASAYCQARMKLPLTVFEPLLRSVGHAVQHAPLDEGRWLGHRTFWVDGSSFGSDIHVMLALRRNPRQVVVTNKQFDGTDMMGELLGKRQRVANQP